MRNNEGNAILSRAVDVGLGDLTVDQSGEDLLKPLLRRKGELIITPGLKRLDSRAQAAPI
jgi:hypothetical protein